MLIHPSDAALEPIEWQTWLAGTDSCETLVINLHPRDHGPEAAAATRQQRRSAAIGEVRTNENS